MSKFLRLFALVVALGAVQAHARSNEPIQNLEDQPATTSSGQPASVAQIKAAILAGGAARGWQVAPSGANEMVASINVRGKHTVSTTVSVKPGFYSIKYKDSANMHYDPSGTIHPSYNKWVHTLSDSIRMELAKK